MLHKHAEVKQVVRVEKDVRVQHALQQVVQVTRVRASLCAKQNTDTLHEYVIRSHGHSYTTYVHARARAHSPTHTDTHC